jgi:hypothetical protein
VDTPKAYPNPNHSTLIRNTQKRKEGKYLQILADKQELTHLEKSPIAITNVVTDSAKDH